MDPDAPWWLRRRGSPYLLAPDPSTSREIRGSAHGSRRVARGIFSNESELGSAGIAAAAAQTREPVRQVLLSMTQTFIDTLVVCSFTGLAIIATGAWSTGADGTGLTQIAFRTGPPGQ